MSLNSIVHQQAGSLLDWNIWKQPLGFIIFFIAADPPRRTGRRWT